MNRFVMLAAACLATNLSHAALVSVADEAGAPLATVMVTQTVTAARKLDTADGGYATPGRTQPVDAEITRFTDATGTATLPDRPEGLSYRLRKPGFRDALIATTGAGESPPVVVMTRETDPAALAAAKPANAWLGALDVGDADTAKHFKLQCAFCHQQGNEFTRMDRTPEAWSCLLYTSPSPRDGLLSRMPSSA